MNNKCKIALKSFMIGIITGVTVIYIVQFVIKIIKGAKLKEAVKVEPVGGEKTQVRQISLAINYKGKPG